MTKNFTFFESYYLSIKDLDPTIKAEFYDVLFEYALYDVEPKETATAIVKALFLMAKPNLDKSKARRDAGKKGGSKSEANESKSEANESKTPKQPSDKDKDKDKEEDKEEETKRDQEIKEILEDLNIRLGTKYKYKTKTTYEAINARLEEGYTIDNFRSVHEKKIQEWRGTDFEKNLTPSTLYRPANFEKYVNQTISSSIPQHSNTANVIDTVFDKLDGVKNDLNNNDVIEGVIA